VVNKALTKGGNSLILFKPREIGPPEQASALQAAHNRFAGKHIAFRAPSLYTLT
jgi:hypothetical protein